MIFRLSLRNIVRYFLEKSLEISFDSKTFRMKFTKFHAQFRSKIQENKERNSSKFVCITFAQYCMSTQNPTNPDEGNWVKPVNHPCKLSFENVQNNWDTDYENLVNLVQRHTNCSTAYCLRKKGGSDELFCRFGFPKETSEKTHLEFETFRSKDGKDHYKVKVVTKRNDRCLNNNQRLQLQGWRANCDIPVIIDYHSCLEYIAKYASKGEKMSSVAKDAFTSVLTILKMWTMVEKL